MIVIEIGTWCKIGPGWLRGHLVVAVNVILSMIEMIPYMKNS
jgi:hypothetical protein